MLYYFFKPFLQLTRKLFFRNFQIKGKENIPHKGPVLFVSNHPATFMDPIIIATSIKPKIYFISKSTVFKTRLAKWFLPKLNMIPVYRKQDSPSEMVKNKNTFEKVFNHLNSGKNILIFPEGISLPDRKLKEIKTGAARMALGAEEITNFQSDIKIICVGINYFDKGKFQTNVVVNIAKPISLKEYKNKYLENQQATVKELTARIESVMEQQVISIDEKETDEFIARIETIYKPILLNELKLNKKDKSNEFILTKRMLDYLDYFKKNDPWRLHEIRNKTSHYFETLTDLKLEDEHLRRTQNQKHFFIKSLGKFFYFLLAMPVIVTGIIFNVIPYLLTDKIAKKMSPHIEYRVALSMVLGMFIYTACYLGYIFTANQLFDSFLINLGLLILFPLTGLYAYLQLQHMQSLIKRWKLVTYFYKRSDEMNTIINLRKEIIDLLDKCRIEAPLVYHS